MSPGETDHRDRLPVAIAMRRTPASLTPSVASRAVIRYHEDRALFAASRRLLWYTARGVTSSWRVRDVGKTIYP